MFDEQLNSSIDEIARQMTDATPADAAGFRGRVLARIEAGDAPRRSWRAAFVLAPIAVAIPILIAVMFVGRPFPPGSGGPAGPNRLRQGDGGLAEPHAKAEGPTPQTGTEPGPKRPHLPTAAQTAARTVGRPGPAGPGAPAPNGSAPEIAALDVSPLQVHSIPVPAIENDSLQLQKLDAIAPIGVTPLGSPSEGDRP